MGGITNKCYFPFKHVICLDRYFTRMMKVLNKKVLLRERKRHATRRVASTHYAVPLCCSPMLFPYPLPGSGKGYPHPPPGPGKEVLPAPPPHLDLGRGYPRPAWIWEGSTPCPPTWTWEGGNPSPPPHPWTREGVWKRMLLLKNKWENVATVVF